MSALQANTSVSLTSEAHLDICTLQFLWPAVNQPQTLKRSALSKPVT